MRQDARARHPDIERLIDQAWRLRHDDTRRARGAAERALALARQRDDALGQAWAELRLSLCDYILAVAAADDEARLVQGIAAMQALGDRRGEAEALNLLANILSSRGRPADAIALHLRCEALREVLGDTAGVIASANNRATALREQGRLDEALELFRTCQQGAQTAGDTAGVAYAQVNLGQTELARDAPAAALRHFELGFAAAVRTEDRALECTALTGLATARLCLGDIDTARDLLGHAQVLAQRTGNVRDAARVCLAWGRLELAAGRPADAEPHLQAALQEARRVHDQGLEHSVRAAMADLEPPSAEAARELPLPAR